MAISHRFRQNFHDFRMIFNDFRPDFAVFSWFSLVSSANLKALTAKRYQSFEARVNQRLNAAREALFRSSSMLFHAS